MYSSCACSNRSQTQFRSAERTRRIVWHREQWFAVFQMVAHSGWRDILEPLILFDSVLAGRSGRGLLANQGALPKETGESRGPLGLQRDSNRCMSTLTQIRDFSQRRSHVRDYLLHARRNGIAGAKGWLSSASAPATAWVRWSQSGANSICRATGHAGDNDSGGAPADGSWKFFGAYFSGDTRRRYCRVRRALSRS